MGLPIALDFRSGERQPSGWDSRGTDGDERRGMGVPEDYRELAHPRLPPPCIKVVR